MGMREEQSNDTLSLFCNVGTNWQPLYTVIIGIYIKEVVAKFEWLSYWVNNTKKSTKTYNTRDSPVVTHLSTSLAVCSLSRAERTGCRVLYSVWSYVPVHVRCLNYMSR